MFTTLDRYILREICIPFVLGMGLFFTVVAFAQVLRVSDAVTGLGITSTEILQALAYSLPPLLGLLVPISCLFASLLGIGRLSADREVAGMAAVGISPYRLLRMPAMVGTTLAIVSALAMNYGESWGIQGLRQLMGRSAQRALTRGVRPREFHEWVPGVVLWAAEMRGRVLYDVVFADRRDPQRPLLMTASEGSLEAGARAEDLIFHMRDGTIYQHEAATAASRVVRFADSLYCLDVERIVGKKARALSAVQEMDMPRLWHEAHDLSLPQERRALTMVTLQRKFALPLATLVFALLAVPLGCNARSGARARGLLWSTVIVGAYYYVGRTLELAARAGHLSPVAAAWLPDLLGLAILALALVRLGRRRA